jgi:ATP-dependent RNA helicase SUPV3L1/SUV3
LCGEEAAVPLITSIAKELGEEIEVNRYERLSPLTTESEAIKSYNRVKPGDCVVAFSRKSIFLIKENIERDTGMRCALVYGGLPPESRTMQADLFNDPNNEYDVIVASDAVGMGLNLYLPRRPNFADEEISSESYLRRWKSSTLVE